MDTLIVNNNGQVLKKLTSGNNLITFEYDVNGNLSKRSESYCFTYNDKLIEYLEVWKYKYDAPNKLYSAMKLPFWIQEVLDDVEGYPILANHLLTEITNQDFEKEDGQIVDTGKIYTSIVSYQLNEHGYPTEITFLEDGEKTSAKVTYAEY